MWWRADFVNLEKSGGGGEARFVFSCSSPSFAAGR